MLTCFHLNALRWAISVINYRIVHHKWINLFQYLAIKMIRDFDYDFKFIFFFFSFSLHSIIFIPIILHKRIVVIFLILCQIFFAKIWSRVRYDISKTEARLKIEKRKISSWEMQNNLSFLFFFFYKKRYFSVKHFSFPTRYQYQFKYRTVTKVFEKKKNGKFCF